MILKIIAGLVLMAAAYCQDHPGHTFTLQTLITHEVPKKVEHYQHYETEYKTEPVHKFVAKEYTTASHSGSFQSLTQHASLGNQNNLLYNEDPKRIHLLPKEPAPVYETHERVRAPVQLKVVQHTVPHATQHRVVQLVQQVPIKPQIIKAASVAPVIHQVPIAPIVHHAAIAPIIQLSPVHHSVAQVSQSAPIQNHIVEVAHQKPIQNNIFEVPYVPEHHEETYNADAYYKESHGESHDESQDEQNEHHIDYYAYPKYEFAYEVKDPHTHDEKYQHESRDGDAVKGVYSLHEPDGSIRTVKYGSDKKTGFHAEVSHKGHTKHIIPHYLH